MYGRTRHMQRATKILRRGLCGTLNGLVASTYERHLTTACGPGYEICFNERISQ